MSKKERERQVLLGLVDLYIKTGKPVGSHTLKSAGFENLSSATIRNYFANLESEGYLQQQHSSGGRIPTESAFRAYAQDIIDSKDYSLSHSPFHSYEEETGTDSSRSIVLHLQRTADILSNHTNCAAFLSAPRFDHDFVIDLKLISIDSERCLCVIITDFGIIQTEVLTVKKKLTTFNTKRIESYFQARLSGQLHPTTTLLDPEEEKIAQQFYNELMIRHLVSYTNFSNEYLYTTGFAKMLHNPDFHDVKMMAASLSLFENQQSLRHLIQHCCSHAKLSLWIGNDLASVGCQESPCTIIAVPYRIHQQVVGAIGLLGPQRIPYRENIAAIEAAAENLSNALTKIVYKFKITYRQPSYGPLPIEGQERKLLESMSMKLLEDKRPVRPIQKRQKK